MNPEKQSHKKIGILIGIVAVLAVVMVTFANETKPDVVSTTNSSQTSSQTQTQNSDVGNTNPQQSDDSSSNTQTVQTTQTPVVVPKQTQPSSTKKSSVYKNGTYSADGSYMTPEGQVSINVTVTLANDIITDANVVSLSGGRTSVRYQDKFISGYKQYVIGKNIADVQLSRVSGSSLTPEGFNNALATIKSQAQS